MESKDELRWKQYEAVLDTYRHHLDIYFKLAALYLTITGAVAGFVFAEGTTSEQRTALLAFLFLVSLAAMLANAFVLFWGDSVQKLLDGLAESLGLERLSLMAGRSLVYLIIGLTGIIATICVVLIA